MELAKRSSLMLLSLIVSPSRCHSVRTSIMASVQGQPTKKLKLLCLHGYLQNSEVTSACVAPMFAWNAASDHILAGVQVTHWVAKEGAQVKTGV